MTVAYPSSFEPARLTGKSKALIVADSEAAEHRARTSLEAGGFSGARTVRAGDAVASLDKAGWPDLLWIELEAFGPDAEGLLERVDADVQSGRYSAVVAAPPELIDPLTAAVCSPDIELVIGRSEVDRAAALALATAPKVNNRARESSSDESAARLRQLSEEVGRIAATLARLSGKGDASPLSAATQAPPTGDLPAIPAESVRKIIRARRERGKYLPADLFADPAWDMLLDLLQAEIVQHRVPVSSLCIAAAVPATTALRWIKSMADRGLLVRRPDPHDGRRVFMEMSRPTSHALRRFFNEVGLALV